MGTSQQVVDSALRHLGATLIRDFIFVIGGTTLLLAFLYLFNRLPNASIDIYYKAYCVALAWMIGYAIQEIFSTLKFVTTAYKRPGKYFIVILKLFTTVGKWDRLPSTEEVDFYKMDLCIDNHSSLKTWIRIERIITLKIVGSTMGPCCLITSVLLFISEFKHQSNDGFAVILGVIAMLFSLIFILINRIKTVQHYGLAYNIYQNCRKCNKSPQTDC